jgi:phosphoheptose isomerase
MLRSKKYKSLIGIAPLVAIASASVVAATSCNAPVVLKEIHANGESDRVTTTELVLTANKSIAHITTNDVRFSMNLIYATSINSVTKDDEVIYTIQVRGN